MVLLNLLPKLFLVLERANYALVADSPPLNGGLLARAALDTLQLIKQAC